MSLRPRTKNARLGDGSRPFQERRIREYFGLKRTTGDIAFEMEVEYANPVLQIDPVTGLIHPNWVELLSSVGPTVRVEHDGSLRNGIEFVSKGPVPAQDLDKHIEELVRAEATAGKLFGGTRWSIRTGTHVHVNVQDFTIEEVLRVSTLYWLIEDYLTQTQGKNRVGNLFCLRASDAEEHVRQFIGDIRSSSLSTVGGAGLRYAALNLAALPKFGSLEFRFLRGMNDPEELSFWGRVFYRLVHNGRTMNPQAVASEPPEYWVPELIGSEAVEAIEKEYGGLQKIRDRVIPLAPLIAVTSDSPFWDKGPADHERYSVGSEDLDLFDDPFDDEFPGEDQDFDEAFTPFPGTPPPRWSLDRIAEWSLDRIADTITDEGD